MTIRVERGEMTDVTEDKPVQARLEDAVRRHLLVRGTVEVIDYGTLPRTERKSKRVYDERLAE
jgi:phenylacetate-CoA ligase